jgi:hypothetical protein
LIRVRLSDKLNPIKSRIVTNFRYLALILLVVSSGCAKGAGDVLGPYYARLEAVPHEKWDALAQKRIFFGHKSVGFNIISGLEDVMKRFPSVRLDIRETADPGDFGRPVFAHAQIGRNKFPQSKIDAFRKALEDGVGQNVDIAFFKFCFVDIDHQTDLAALVESYVQTLENLKSRFPSAEFVAFTVPLVSRPVGLVTRLKKLLGRMPYYDAEHVQRSLYNDTLRERYKGRLFDLAAVESRIDATRRATLEKDGKEYEILNRAYTDDGGHLNAVGRQIVAIELLIYLASIV